MIGRFGAYSLHIRGVRGIWMYGFGLVGYYVKVNGVLEVIVQFKNSRWVVDVYIMLCIAYV